MARRFVVAGATGRVGSVVARELLAKGHRVRAVVRNGSRGRLDGRVDAVPAALEDRAALARALAGAEGFFALLPEDVPPEDFHGHRRRMADAIADAVREAGVPRVVMLSAVAAGVAEGNGPARGLHHLEHALRATPAAVVALRSAYFQENVAAMAPLARGQGIYPCFMPSADVSFPTAATGDVGRVAAERLAASGAATEAVDLLGPACSVRQMADALGRVLGREVRVVEVPPDRHIAALVEGGVPPPVAAVLAEMFAGAASGIMTPRGDRTVALTTGLEETLRSALAGAGAA